MRVEKLQGGRYRVVDSRDPRDLTFPFAAHAYARLAYRIVVMSGRWFPRMEVDPQQPRMMHRWKIEERLARYLRFLDDQQNGGD